MSKFNHLAETILREADGYDHGSGFAVDVYLRRQGDVRSLKRQLIKVLHKGLLVSKIYGADPVNDYDPSRQGNYLKSSANFVTYHRSEDNDSSVLELTITGGNNDIDELRKKIESILGGQYKFDIYPVETSK